MGHVVIGQDRPDARQRFGPGDVDALDQGVRVGAAENFRLQETVELHVAHIGGFAGNFIIGVEPLHRPANHKMLVQSRSLLSQPGAAAPG